MAVEQNLQEVRNFWDNAADTFDEEADHGLRDPAARQAWTTLPDAGLALQHWSKLLLPGGRLVLVEGHSLMLRSLTLVINYHCGVVKLQMNGI